MSRERHPTSKITKMRKSKPNRAQSQDLLCHPFLIKTDIRTSNQSTLAVQHNALSMAIKRLETWLEDKWADPSDSELIEDHSGVQCQLPYQVRPLVLT